MSTIARASLNDSQIFLDLGSALDANFQKLHLDLNKFSIRTVETILTFREPCYCHLNFLGLIRLHFRFHPYRGSCRPARAKIVNFPRTRG
jgi:hypothetical protein